MNRNAFPAFAAITALFAAQNGLSFLLCLHTPPLFLIGIVFFSLLEGPLFGACFGVLAGLYLEIFSVGPIGYEMAIMGFLGAFAGLSASKVFRDSFLAQFLLPAFSFYIFVLWNAVVFKWSFGEPLGAGVIADAFFPVDLAVTALLSPLIFAVLRKVSHERRPRRSNWS